MALQSSQRVSFCVEYVNLGVIKRNDYVLGSQMQARHHTAVLGDVSRRIVTAGAPCGIDKIPLFEVGLV